MLKTPQAAAARRPCLPAHGLLPPGRVALVERHGCPGSEPACAPTMLCSTRPAVVNGLLVGRGLD